MAASSIASRRERSTSGLVVTRPSAWEWWIAVAVVLAASAVVGVSASRWWFHSDAWDFLTNRSFSAPLTILKPHAGHWQTPTTLLYLTIKSLAGMDFWPWFFLPRLVGWACLSLWIWFTLRKQGTHPAPALASLVVISILGSSGWQDLSTIGNILVLAAAYATASILAGVPTQKGRWALFFWLLLAVTSSGLGVAVLAGAITTAVLSKKLRRHYLTVMLAVGVIYTTWYVTIGRTTDSVPGFTRGLTLLPKGTLELLGNAAVWLFQTGFDADRWIFAVPVLLGVVWILVARRTTPFQLTMLFTAGAYIAMVILVRVAGGLAQLGAVRYAQNLILLLIPVFLPLVSRTAGRAVVTLTTMSFLVIAPPNFTAEQHIIDFWENRAQASREVVETAAELIEDGEPWVATASIDPPRAGVLTARGLQRLIGQGWKPAPSRTSEEIIEQARGDLRFDVRRLPGTAPEASSCTSVTPDEPLSTIVEHRGVSEILTTGGDAILEWKDSFGTGVREVNFDGRLASGALVRWASPEASAVIEIQPDRTVRVCDAG